MDPLNKPTDKKTIHTFEEDMALAIQENKDGLVKSLIHEQEEKEAEKRNLIKYSAKNKVYIALALIFVLLASSVIVYLYFKDDIDSLFVKRRFSPLIFHESSKLIDITKKNKDNIISTVTDEVFINDNNPEELKGIYFLENRKTVGFNRFLNLIESNFIGPKDLFDENFLIGIIKQSQSQNNINNTPEADTENPNQIKKLLDNYVTLSAVHFFKPDTSEFLDLEARNEMKELVGFFLDTVSFDHSKIKIIGTYPTEKNLDNKEELSKKFRDVGVSIFNEVVKEKYKDEEIAKISVENFIKDISLSDIYSEEKLEQMSQEEKNEKIDLNQGIQYLSEALPKPIVIDNLNKDLEIDPVVVDAKKDAISNFPKGTDLFILLKVNSFADVFGQMRIWENKMFADLHDLFGIDIFTDTSYLLTKDFVDGVVQNKNARILYDDGGKIVFMYVYIDENFIVITNTEEATREVILRVNSSKIKK